MLMEGIPTSRRCVISESQLLRFRCDTTALKYQQSESRFKGQEFKVSLSNLTTYLNNPKSPTTKLWLKIKLYFLKYLGAQTPLPSNAECPNLLNFFLIQTTLSFLILLLWQCIVYFTCKTVDRMEKWAKFCSFRHKRQTWLNILRGKKACFQKKISFKLITETVKFISMNPN